MIPAREGFEPDADASSAFLYTIAIHAPPDGDVSLHCLSFVGSHYRIMFTAPGPASRRRFLDAVSRDLAGYLRARFGWKSCAFAVEEVVALDDAEAQLEAAARVLCEARGAFA